ncbi:MAG: hypothetical protein KBF32_08225 [Chitinophagales bacterium]|nr:hypothetical protein [Chitinophagaceae bacterium]MBP9883374.1 hypothetical protein [Chitinophagales bacterium]
MKKFILPLIILLSLGLQPVLAQEDLSALLESMEEKTTEYATAGFKTTRVINSHSIENVGAGVMDFKISHRFGYINGGIYELFGLDQASIRIGLDYGITKQLMVGFGRSSFEKTYDGFVKYKFLRQSSGVKNMPISAAWVSTMAIKTLKPSDPERENYFTSNLYYAHQLIIGRKFSEAFTLQLMPSMVHRNLVETTNDNNDIFAIGIAARQKITRRVAVNAEYYYQLNQTDPDITNSLSIGFDLETGGHVFQLHFTNSTSMIEKGFIPETTGNWLDGDIHFGFNVSRVFTIVNKEMKKPE